ncbi:adenylate/guanylate cyclase domain-containing protein [Thalassobellus sediminis]|uniref:adenylate/guanylate cyclase domain-containing protein n=1 Tax=Thalassobellus sediminis TaxID=3367753 RepID=UPI00378902F9
MLTPKAKRNIQRILPFGLIWFVFGMVFMIVEHAASPKNVASGAIKMDFNVFVFASIAVTMLGLLIGSVELFFLNRLFTKSSFIKKIFGKLFIYGTLLFIVILFTYPIAASIELDTSVFDTKVWEKLSSFFKSLTLWSTALQMAVSLGVSVFYAEISDNIGHGILISFFTGKYHTPKEETRIFMFLDMKSSTSIAEKLGHIKYFQLLKEYYYNISNPIIDFSGEIYQYVGDEIVVSWPYKDGVKNNNCIHCFYAMKAQLEKHKEWYYKNFGLAPSFKAGFHLGKVTTGEIGSIKKEIIFTGDVLNATARIQSLCNYYNVDILISGDLIKVLNLDTEFNIKSLGENELRGKQEAIELYTIG